MTVRGRKRMRIGPLMLNLTSTGFASWRVSSGGLKLGSWSWNSRTHRQRVDVPGLWSWTSQGRSTRRAGRRHG